MIGQRRDGEDSVRSDEFGDKKKAFQKFKAAKETDPGQVSD